MKKSNCVKRAEVRNEMNEVKTSKAFICKRLYAYKGEETPKLAKILPSSANDLCLLIPQICEDMHVGELATKTIKNEKGEKVVVNKVKKNKEGVETTYEVEFTQSLLITWLLREQKNVKALAKKAREAEDARRAAKKAAKAAEAEAANMGEREEASATTEVEQPKKGILGLLKK